MYSEARLKKISFNNNFEEKFRLQRSKSPFRLYRTPTDPSARKDEELFDDKWKI